MAAGEPRQFFSPVATCRRLRQTLGRARVWWAGKASLFQGELPARQSRARGKSLSPMASGAGQETKAKSICERLQIGSDGQGDAVELGMIAPAKNL